MSVLHAGCQQIAAGGGLETLSNLIVGHLPSFSSCISSCSQTSDATLPPQCSPELVHQTDRHLTDQELDFLVAILGLLVNLVEKDSRNRSRSAAASVSLPMSGGSEETGSRRDVIPLLCSIFLANQGADEAAEDGRLLPWVDQLVSEELMRERFPTLAMGNEKSNTYWEAELPLNYDTVGIENFIRAKYEEKRWIARDGKTKSPSKAQDEKVPIYRLRPGNRVDHGYTNHAKHSSERRNTTPLATRNSIPVTKINFPPAPKVSVDPKPAPVVQTPEKARTTG